MVDVRGLRRRGLGPHARSVSPNTTTRMKYWEKRMRYRRKRHPIAALAGTIRWSIAVYNDRLERAEWDELSQGAFCFRAGRVASAA